MWIAPMEGRKKNRCEADFSDLGDCLVRKGVGWGVGVGRSREERSS